MKSELYGEDLMYLERTCNNVVDRYKHEVPLLRLQSTVFLADVLGVLERGKPYTNAAWYVAMGKFYSPDIQRVLNNADVNIRGTGPLSPRSVPQYVIRPDFGVNKQVLSRHGEALTTAHQPMSTVSSDEIRKFLKKLELYRQTDYEQVVDMDENIVESDEGYIRGWIEVNGDTR